MNEALRRELIAMRDEDLCMREDLLRRGVLGDGYHPKMEAVHGRNAARLRQLIGEHGWPGKTLVGEDGAEAAWLILQHAIGEPDFQRSGLKALKAAAEAGEVPRWQVAYLEDRVRFFEGRPQLYATQFDLVMMAATCCTRRKTSSTLTNGGRPSACLPTSRRPATLSRDARRASR